MNNNFINYFLLPLIIWINLKSFEFDNFIQTWMFMEMNTFFFIVMLALSKNKFSSIMYFMTQIIASSLLLSSMVLNLPVYNFENLLNYFIYSALMIKMSIIPFHIWMPLIFKVSSWMNILLLSTIQKIIPLILIINFVQMNTFIFINLIMSIIISSIIPLKFYNLKLIMAYSSINHSSWIIILTFIDYPSMICYFILYLSTSITIIYMFHKTNLNQFMDLKFLNLNTTKQIYMFFNLLSYVSLPPFMGFSIKWIFIELTLNISFFFYLMMMILYYSSIMFLYIFMRMFFPFLLSTPMPNLYIKIYKQKNFNYTFLLFMNLFTLSFILFML